MQSTRLDTFPSRASAMFLPAGVWHRVDCEDDGGSLSLNVSLSGARYLDVALRRVAQLRELEDAPAVARELGRAQQHVHLRAPPHQSHVAARAHHHGV